MSDGDAATAFAPGHVTGFFSVERAADQQDAANGRAGSEATRERAEDPARTGSRGAGVTLSDGVTTRVTPSDETTVRLNGTELDVESARRVLDALGVTATVDAETTLPLGAGFGVSGAMALGTALAANAVFDLERTENGLVSAAHVAEVEADSGLGDVVAQARGGVPIRVEPGAPGHGELDGVPATSRIEYVSFGGLSTSDIIGGDTDALSAAGERALVELRERPTLPEFVRLSRGFSREAGLLDDDVADAISAVTEAGGEAAMAMLGRTVFALGTGLSDAGYDPEVSSVHAAGATLQ